MKDEDVPSWRFPTEEEWDALTSLLRDGKIGPTVKIIKEECKGIHKSLLRALEDLDDWDNDLHWVIKPTPKFSRPKKNMSGRPSFSDADPFYDYKMLLLARKIGQIHIEYIDKYSRLPKKREIRDCVMQDGALSALLKFSKKGRTRQDALCDKAHKLLLELKVSQN